MILFDLFLIWAVLKFTTLCLQNTELKPELLEWIYFFFSFKIIHPVPGCLYHYSHEF